jgi:hemoglobin
VNKAMVPEAIPVAERNARRAESTRVVQAATGLDEVVIERLVRSFYGTARRDELLGPIFDRVSDWEAHIAQISAFWSSVALNTGRYHGQPMAAHLLLGLERAHFDRWLALFEQSAQSICTQAAVDHLMVRARRIAQSLELGIDANRGVLPGVRCPVQPGSPPCSTRAE